MIDREPTSQIIHPCSLRLKIPSVSTLILVFGHESEGANL